MSPAERDRLISEVDAVFDLAVKRYQEAKETHREARKAIDLLWRIAGTEATNSAPSGKPISIPSQPEPVALESSTNPVKAYVLEAIARIDKETFTSVDVLSLVEHNLPGQDRNAKLNRVSTALRRLAEKNAVITLVAKGKGGEPVQYRKATEGRAVEE